jgi:hypothetical protein
MGRYCHEVIDPVCTNTLVCSVPAGKQGDEVIDQESYRVLSNLTLSWHSLGIDGIYVRNHIYSKGMVSMRVKVVGTAICSWAARGSPGVRLAGAANAASEMAEIAMSQGRSMMDACTDC